MQDTALHALLVNHSPQDKGIWQLVITLLKKGASLERGPHGSSPLTAAALNGFEDIAWLLLFKGANPRLCDMGTEDYHRPDYSRIVAHAAEQIACWSASGSPTNDIITLGLGLQTSF